MIPKPEGKRPGENEDAFVSRVRAYVRAFREAEEAWWRGKRVTLALRTKCGAIRDDITWDGRPPETFHVPLLGTRLDHFLPYASTPIEPSVASEIRVFELERVNHELLIAFYRERS